MAIDTDRPRRSDPETHARHSARAASRSSDAPWVARRERAVARIARDRAATRDGRSTRRERRARLISSTVSNAIGTHSRAFDAV